MPFVMQRRRKFETVLALAALPPLERLFTFRALNIEDELDIKNGHHPYVFLFSMAADSTITTIQRSTRPPYSSIPVVRRAYKLQEKGRFFFLKKR